MISAISAINRVLRAGVAQKQVGTNGCRVIARVHKRAKSFEKESEFADVLRQRSHLIADTARYHNDDDAVPVSNSVATVFAISEEGAVKTTDANLLGENYWGLATILSR